MNQMLVADLTMPVILTLGCVNNGLSTVSPIVVSSNTSLAIGGVPTIVDIRIGFWGICFGPPPYTCASSVSIIPTRSAADLMRLIPASRGGANTQLLRIALSLQASLIVLSGIVLLVMLTFSLLANAIEIYFNVGGIGEEHVRASVWARAFDWAAAAGSIVAFSTYRSLIDNTEVLLQTATGAGINIAGGTVASGMFAAVVGTTAAGAIFNTFMTAGDAGRYAYQAAKAMEISRSNLRDLEVGTGGGFDKFKEDMTRRKAAYERFP